MAHSVDSLLWNKMYSRCFYAHV